jgi:hypothetical protein
LLAHGLEEAKCAETGRIRGVLWKLEGDLDVTLPGEVVDDLGPHRANHGLEAAGVGKVRVVEMQPAFGARRGANGRRIQPASREQAGLAHEAVHLVAGPEQRLP